MRGGMAWVDMGSRMMKEVGRDSKELDTVLPHGTSWSWRLFAVLFSPFKFKFLQLWRELPYSWLQGWQVRNG